MTTEARTVATPAAEMRGRRVWITGASRGLGLSVARAFLDAGADVALTARTVEPLTELRDAYGSADQRVLVLPCSVGDSAQVDSAAECIASEWGGLDVLVNAAGVSPTFKPAEEVQDDDWESVVDVNLNGTFYCSRAAARLMLAGSGGAIVNVTSIHARVGMARLAAYSASKGGIEALTRTLALEWASDGIRVNSIAPGYFATEMTEGLRSSDKWRERLLDRIPLGRFGEPQELVPAVLFLASPGAGYMTGSCLTVDGGWTAA
jgi:NAD(P)-dependent dehydrogenase (short-subunit alcohol dehydrogenase family)